MSRESRGRAVVNLLNLRRTSGLPSAWRCATSILPGHYLVMATKQGLVKKTPLEAYSRPKKGGIIAIKLREDDELVDVVVVKPNDQLLMATAAGKAIRFSETDARSMGRNTSGVKGIRLRKGDEVVGMVVADPDATLLTVCEQGYGKRTWFGPGETLAPIEETSAEGADESAVDSEPVDAPEIESEAEAEDLSSSKQVSNAAARRRWLDRYQDSKRNGPVLRSCA